MLRCCPGRDAMWIDFQAKADVSREFFGHMETTLKPLGFRKHWAKGMDNGDPKYVSKQFPMVGEFLGLMKEFDPEGKFRNTHNESWYHEMDKVVSSRGNGQPSNKAPAMKTSRSSLRRKNSLTNWAETFEVEEEDFRYPESIQDVVALVNSNSKIRCAGAMHSCAPLISSEGIVMSLIRLNKIINIDADNKVVKCQSGVRVHDLCEALAPYGLAMGTLGTIDWQTVSGAVMTGK